MTITETEARIILTVFSIGRFELMNFEKEFLYKIFLAFPKQREDYTALWQSLHTA